MIGDVRNHSRMQLKVDFLLFDDLLRRSVIYPADPCSGRTSRTWGKTFYCQMKDPKTQSSDVWTKVPIHHHLLISQILKSLPLNASLRTRTLTSTAHTASPLHSQTQRDHSSASYLQNSNITSTANPTSISTTTSVSAKQWRTPESSQFSCKFKRNPSLTPTWFHRIIVCRCCICASIEGCIYCKASF